MTKEITSRLGQLLAEGESETVEFKESFDEEAIETVAAFANTGGGTLLVGVADNGIIKGLMLGKETLRDWTNRIAQATHIHPHQIDRISQEGKTVVVVQVTESAIKPVPCRGRYFKRIGKSNRQMSDDDLTRAVLEKVGMTWDQVVEPRVKFTDLDPEQLRRFRKLCNLKGRRVIPDTEADATVLEKLGLLHEGQLSRAAVLLFARDLQRFYPSAFVKLGRFRSPTLIVDDRELYGTLFDQVEGFMGYFKEHLQTRFEFTGEIARELIWEYPLEALREAITNAVCHRDYMDLGHTQVRWYDDQILFVSPGGLPPPLRIEELKQPHRSVPRNRLIAEIFFDIGWIERWGSGIQKILDECSAAGMPEPTFDEKQGALWVAFAHGLAAEEHPLLSGLNERQKQVLRFIKEHGSITNREYRQLIGLSDESARRELKELVAKGILYVEGSGRNVRYIPTKVGD